MSDTDVGNVIQRYIQIRDARTAMKRDYEAKDAPLAAALDKLETWLLQKSMEEGDVSFSVRGIGTAYPSTSLKVSCKDWGILDAWAAETQNTAIYERRVSKEFVKAYMETNNGQVPPAVQTTTERRMVVRRA